MPLPVLWVFNYQSWYLVVSVGDENSFWLWATAARTGATIPITTMLVMSCRRGLFFEWSWWNPFRAVVMDLDWSIENNIELNFVGLKIGWKTDWWSMKYENRLVECPISVLSLRVWTWAVNSIQVGWLGGCCRWPTRWLVPVDNEPTQMVQTDRGVLPSIGRLVPPHSPAWVPSREYPGLHAEIAMMLHSLSKALPLCWVEWLDG